MNHEKLIDVFTELGNRLRNLSKDELSKTYIETKSENNWFTEENIKLSIENICKYLQRKIIGDWSSRYSLNKKNKKIGVIMAGNIPLVGFHDLLCVLMSGHTLIAKTSSKDNYLMNLLINQLLDISNEFMEKIQIVDRIKNVDAIIATGSNNSARYFQYYFAKYPNIIRKNRTSIAILDGEENINELELLGDDIFQYFGLGCRNVSKIFVPNEYDFNKLFKAFEKYSYVTNHFKYHNNYEYQKSIFLINNKKHYDNGFLLMEENNHLISPISILYYEIYENSKLLKKRIELASNNIQCIVSNSKEWEGIVGFGKAQNPNIDDYADNIDTMKFLSKL